MITRRRHPFEGQSLAVVASINRSDVLQLLVVLPDGDRALVPADWTDLNLTNLTHQGAFAHSSNATQDPGFLAGLADLLQLRKIIDALQNRRFESATVMEGNHAVQTHTHRPERSTTAAVSAVATDERADAGRSARSPRASYRPQTHKRAGKGGKR